MTASIIICTALISSSPVSPLIDKLESTGYMTGYFSQTDYWALTLEEEVSSGIMHLAQPDLFRLSYDDGGASGYDGSELYTLEPDLQQVIVYSSRAPESFLHLLESCGDSTVSSVTEMDGDSLMVELEGDFGEGINRMRVGFSASDSLPFLFSTTDYNGNTTTYRLWDISTSDEYDPSVFSYEVPSGYSVIIPEDM